MIQKKCTSLAFLFILMILVFGHSPSSYAQSSAATVNPQTCVSAGCSTSDNFQTKIKKTREKIEDRIGATKKSALTGKVKEEHKDSATGRIIKKIDDVEDSWNPMFAAQSESFTQNIQWLAEQIGKFQEAKLKLTKELMKKDEAAKISKELSLPTSNLGCERITAIQGALEGQDLRQAAEDDLNTRASLSFQNTEGSLYAYGSADAIRVMYNDWLKTWCVKSANDGNLPDECGVNRDEQNLKLANLDIKSSDILFSGETWPDRELLPALRNLIFYLGVRPVEPVSLPNMEDPFNQAAMMDQRRLHARKNMADAVFNHLASKRVPVMANGEWMQQIKKLTFESDASGQSLGQTIEDIGEKVSYAQWMQIMTHDRFLGTDYFLRVANLNDSQTIQELVQLNALYLIQEREFYHLWERLLGLVSSDYALAIDTGYAGDTIGGAE